MLNIWCQALLRNRPHQSADLPLIRLLDWTVGGVASLEWQMETADSGTGNPFHWGRGASHASPTPSCEANDVNIDRLMPSFVFIGNWVTMQLFVDGCDGDNRQSFVFSLYFFPRHATLALHPWKLSMVVDEWMLKIWFRQFQPNGQFFGFMSNFLLGPAQTSLGFHVSHFSARSFPVSIHRLIHLLHSEPRIVGSAGVYGKINQESWSGYPGK